MANINIKRYNGSSWEIHYPKTTIGQVINLSSQLANMQSDINGKLSISGKAADSDKLGGVLPSGYALASHPHSIANITGLQTALNGKENTPYLTISRNDGGGAKFTKFLEVDYNGTNSNKAVYVKVSMRAGHGNAVSYVFNEDIFIQVANTGDVTVRSPKYYAGVSTLSGRYYGDIAYTVDALNKIVKFYTVIGQYTTAQFTPPIRLNASTGGTVTPITGTYVDDFDSLNAIYAPRQWYGVKSTDAEFIYEGDPRLTNARTPTTHSHPKSQITNFDSEVLALSPAGARPASDVSAWAKAANKPTYTATEVGARPDTWMPTAAQVGARPAGDVPWGEVSGKPSFAPSNAQKNSDITKAEIEAKLTGVVTSHTHDDRYYTETEIDNLIIDGGDL